MKKKKKISKRVDLLTHFLVGCTLLMQDGEITNLLKSNVMFKPKVLFALDALN